MQVIVPPVPVGPEAIQAHPSSADSAPPEYLMTLPPTEVHVLFSESITRFRARVVDVLPNGQCFYGALYAAIVGHEIDL